MTIATAELSSAPFEEGKLQRSISWTGAFWVASGGASARPVLDWRHCRDDGHSRRRDLDRVNADGFSAILRLCGDGRTIP